MTHKKPDSERFEALEMSEKMGRGRSPRHKAVLMAQKRKKRNDENVEKNENPGKKGRY